MKRVPLTFRHRAGVTPYMSLCGLAGSCVFGKQLLEPLLCDRAPFSPRGLQVARHPIFRSYGVSLPSSLARDHSFTLAYLCPATCVGLRYGRSQHPAAGVSWKRRASRISLWTDCPARQQPGLTTGPSARTGCACSAPAADLFVRERPRNIDRIVHRLRPSASA